MGVLLLYFSYFSPTPCAAQRRRASVVLRRRGNLITGTAAMRRCPFGGERVGAKTAFWMACALCFVVRLKNGWRKDAFPERLAPHSGASRSGRVSEKRRVSLPRRAAPLRGGEGCHEWKADFMIKRVCLGNNRQLYFYVQNIQREVQRRAAPLLVWRRAKISLRMVCAALRRKPSGGIMRVKNGFIIERK